MTVDPGWYADPWDINNLRYHDGYRWTEHAGPAHASAHSSHAQPVAATRSSTAASGGGYLFTLAILAAIGGGVLVALADYVADHYGTKASLCNGAREFTGETPSGCGWAEFTTDIKPALEIGGVLLLIVAGLLLIGSFLVAVSR